MRGIKNIPLRAEAVILALSPLPIDCSIMFVITIGLAGWLGKTSVQLGSTEVLTTNTNGIRLPDADIRVRIEEIIVNLENNEQETAYKNTEKLSLYELPPDIKLKIDRVIKSFDNDKINTAVSILRSI